MDEDTDVEKQNRVLLRPWLENMLETESIPGLEWFDAEKTMFKVPWKHRSKKDWSMRHSSVFLEWAKNTGRWSEGDPPPNFAQLKTRLRCAFNKAPDIDEMKDCHCSKGEEPFKVYRFNTRRGDLKSALGQKSCQKTVGSRQGRVLGSPAVLKYESCEEEVVDDDDNAIYGEAEIHSLTFSSGESASGFGKFEVAKVEIGQNCLSAFSGNDPAWSYRGCVPQCESRDSKLPVIPLTVEMMTSSSLNDDSDCDGESPNNVWHDSSNRSVSVSAPDDALQTTVKREVLSENIHQIKTKEMRKPDSEDSTDKIHLLQMASLFVEAAERKKEKDIQQDDMTPEQPTVSAIHMDTALSHYPSNQYMIIMPSHCEIETQNEGSVTSGYVTPTSSDVIDVKLPFQEPISPKTSVDINFAESEVYQLEVAGVDAPDLHNSKKFEETDSVKVTDSVQKKDEAVDLTKSSLLVKSSVASEGLQSDCQAVDKIQPLGCSGSRNIEAAKIQLSIQNGGDDLTFSTQAANDVLMPLPEQSTMDQIRRYLGKRSEQSRHQLEWENHLRSWESRLRSWESRLRSWELQLQSKEETLYWRDRCLQSELGINSRPLLNCQHSKELNVCCDNSVLTLASSKQPCSLKDMLTLTPSTAAGPSCSSVIVSAGLLNSGVNKESKVASVINEEMADSQLIRNCLQGNKNFGLAHPLNQLANNLCPSQVKEGSGKLDAEQLNLSKSYSVCGTKSSDVQSVSVMSLIASNQGVPMIVPFIVRQNLVPIAQSLNPDTGVLIRNSLDSKSSAKAATLLNVVDGLEAKKCSLRENTKILSAESDSDKSLRYNEGSSCSQISDLDLPVQISESTVEKLKEVVNLEEETEQERDREQKNKVPIFVLDCSSQNMNCVENSNLKHLDSTSPESIESLHSISIFRNSQKGHKSKYDTTTSVDCVASSGHLDVQPESKNCQFIGAIPTELKPEVVPKALQKIIVSFPQVSLSIASGQTTTWSCSKTPTDFRNWLRAKTEIICKEESLEGRKNIEDNVDQSRHCSEDGDNECSSKSEFRVQMINQDDSHNHLQHNLNLLPSASDANAVLVSTPVLTPQVPLVVENENDFLETDSVDGIVTKSSHFSSTNLVKKRKQSFEKQDSFKKCIVDALL